ncbi:hypothetical protein SAMN05216583_1463 [Selenomonas sp. KH1T6]|nr:hypothetical protein SAMN05216583_1463 [Selenomonas ruminantium]
MCQVNSYLLYKMELLGDFVCLLEFDMFIKHKRYFPDNESENKYKIFDKIRVMVFLPPLIGRLDGNVILLRISRY